MSNSTPDLFGRTSVQGDLFGGADIGARTEVHIDPTMIRRRLESMLADVRAAEARSPWTPETTRLNRLLFPQMASWLPPEERDQLRFEFETELKRLSLAA